MIARTQPDALFCPFCRRKLLDLGPSVEIVIMMMRPVPSGDPMKPGEIGPICPNERCGQRWAVSLTVAHVA